MTELVEQRGRRRRRPAIRRRPDEGVIAGVMAGLAGRFGIDPVLLRIGFAVVVVATGGIALIAYAIAWASMPIRGESSTPAVRMASKGRASFKVGLGFGFLTLSVLLLARELGIWWSDQFVWPLVLAAAGAGLLWRQTRTAEEAEPAADLPLAEPRMSEAEAAPPSGRRPGIPDLYRGGFGIALIAGAALLFLSSNDALGAARDAVLTVVVVVLALGLILAPFLWRLGRNLADERAERIRSQERAELAAHIHDSVLQTLTLVQRRADDEREVVRLARRQERELRSWLFDGAKRTEGDSLIEALEAAAAQVEDEHGTPIDVVAVGDRETDERSDALVAAAREAMVNAAKFASEGGPIAVYAELGAERADVFVRDRGPGFDPDSVPADRRGVRESILGRMQRHGGRGTIRAGAGSGTEIELAMEWGER